MSNFGLIMDQVTGSAPGHKAGEVQLYASSSTNEAGTTQLFMKDSAGTEFVVGGAWKLEDGDGTELAISGGAQLKFAEGNGGVDINWTDVSHGVDDDEYDLTFTLDLNGVAAAAVDVANDSIAIIDANDGNGTKKESIADLVGAMAGTVTSTGLSDSSGVLSVDINNLTGESTPQDADLVVVYDNSATALRKMTRAEFIEGAALDSINIDGGAIDGTPIGANSAAAATFTTVTVNTALVPDSSGGADLGSTSAELGDIYIADDKKIQFGNGQDATIEYDEDGTDELRFAGAAVTFEQAVSFDGNVTLGDAASDTVSVTGQFNTDLVPSSDNARDLGSSSKQWKDLYVNGAAHIDALGQSLDAGNFNISNLNALTASAIQVNQLDVVTINSVTQSDLTLEVQDKLIVSALSASSANSDGGGLRIGGGSTVVGHAAVLWNHASSSLDFSIGDESQILVKDGSIVPSRDNNVDLGASGAEYKDLYLDGVAYIDDLRADQLGAALDANSQAITNINVDSGAIDGTVIGANSAAAATFTTVNVNTALLPDSSGGADLGSASKELGDVYVADDKGVIFGSDQDVKLEYDEDGTDSLLISGGDVTLADDKKLCFGTGQDASFEYDEDGNDVLLYAGANMRFGDDIKLEFGASGDAGIEYDEDGTDQLRIHAPAAGVVIAGSTPSLTIGDAGAEDTKLVFDGNAQDFYMGLDDSADKLLLGLGSTVGTTPNMTLNSANRNVQFHGNVQVDGNNLADNAGNAVISFDGSGNGGFNAAMTVGGGYGSTGVTISSAGAIQANNSLTVDEGATFGGGYGSSGLSISNAGVIQMDGGLTAGSDGSGANFKAHGAAANEFMSYDKDTNLLQLNGSDGNTIVSIGGDATSEYAIDVPTGANNKNKIRAAAFVTYSDESLKQDVASMSNTALDTVMSLEGVEFTWKDSGERDFGFIAQDVQSVLPKAVHTAEDGVQGVDYSRLTSVLVEAVKAQQVQIEDLKKVISNLKK